MARPPAGRSNADKPKSRPDKTRSRPDRSGTRPDKASEVAVEEVEEVTVDEVTADEVAADETTADQVDEDAVDEAAVDEADASASQIEDEVDEASGDSGRTAQTDAFWARVRIDPLEIALPAGVGYTLRAYRLDSEITAADVSDRQDDVALPARDKLFDDGVLGDDLDGVDLEDEDDEDLVDIAEDDDEDEDDSDAVTEVGSADDEDDDADGEEVPLFLSQAGHLLLFRTPDALVEFIQSDAEHDMSQLDTWLDLVDGVRTGYVVPLPDDSYELDLVVANLRGGHDSWDPKLIVQSGQLARDLAHALRVDPVMLTLAPGSPLDDLDEALRSVVSGGFGGFLARRKVKKIGEQTATLGWRTIIGKISTVVDWRD